MEFLGVVLFNLALGGMAGVGALILLAILRVMSEDFGGGR